MSRYIGNYVRVPSSEPQQASAPGIWSINEQLNYQRANLWPPARDPYYNQTVLHLSGDVAGTRETSPVTQPRTFLSDASTNNFLLTPNGDVSARPFSPYGGNNYSVYFPGGTARVQFPSGNIIPASGTYTIECWIYPISLNATYGGVIASQGTTPSGDNGRTGLSITAAGILTFGIGESFPSFNSGSNVIKLNQWTHVAITRNNTVFTMYINGNRINQVTSSKTTDSGFLRLGTLWDGDGNGLVPYVGYISNFRIVYSVLTDFTNRTDSLTAISNTALLTCQSNRFIDNSSNNYLATIVGGPRVSDNSPFVSLDVTSGSAYHDSSGDSLTIPTNTVFNFTGDFSVESWMFPMTTGVTVGIATKYVGGSLSGSEWYFVIDGANSRLGIALDNNSGEDYFTSATNSIIYNAWNHCLVTRVGNAVRLFVNGVLQGYNTTSRVLNTTSTVVTIGGNNNYQSDLRIVKGGIPSAYSTSATTIGSSIFTPPSRPISINDTLTSGSVSLLTLQTRAPANNQGILDTSPNNFVVTRTGNVAQGTFTPFSPTGWGNYFNGSSYVTLPNNAAFGFSTGNFTVEMWVNFVSFTDGTFVFDGRVPGGSAASILGNIQANQFTASGGIFTNGIVKTGLVTGRWYHIAVVRNGSTLELFFDGVSAGTDAVYSTGDAGTSNPFAFGARSTGLNPSTVYISNARIVKGQCLYTGPFTPSVAPLTATSVGTSGTNVASSITGSVSLLVFQSNRFKDNSPNNFTITTSGSPSVQAFSPFAPAQSYMPSQIGGSAYFDGTSDYLKFAVNQVPLALGNSDFTIEAWVYRLNTNTAGILVGQSDLNTAAGSSYVLYVSSSATSDVYSGSSGFGITSPNPGINQWAHVALVRTGGTYSSYLNGVRVGNRTDLSTATVNTGSTTYAPSVGGFSNSTSLLTGYISGLRLIKGSGGYNANDTNIVIPTAPPVAIPNTSLLLNFTNGGIVDATGKNNLETVANSGVQTSQAKWSPGSMYFDGTGDYLQCPISNIWDFGTGDFTVEMWVYYSTASRNGSLISYGGYGFASADSAGWSIQINATYGSLFFNTGATQNLFISSNNTLINSTLPNNQWNHVAAARQGTNLRLYVNGSQVGNTITNSVSCSSSSYTPKIACDQAAAASSLITGYLNDIRITKGYARYVTGTGANANQMVFNGTNTLALPTGPFPLA